MSHLNLNENELNDIIKEWKKVKEERLKLEKREEKCKNLLFRVMDENKEDEIKTHKYSVIRKKSKRLQLLKSNVPKEIYDEYASYSQYITIHLKES